MVYFYLAVYFLVNIWIQNGRVQGGPFSIWANPTTVSPGEEYAITCQSVYANFWFKRNNSYIAMVSFETCNIQSSSKATDYICESIKHGHDYVVKLKVLRGESSPQTVQWNCSHINRITASKILNITVRRLDPSKTTQQQTHRTHITTPPQTPSTSSSNKGSRIPNKPSSSSAPSDQPPVSSNNNVCKQSHDFNLIAVCVVLVLSIIMNVIMVLLFLCVRRKLNQAKQGSLALEPRGIQAEGNYDNMDRTLGNEDDGHTYDTAQFKDVPERSNPNSNGDDIPS